MFDIQNITFGYGKFNIFENLSFKIDREDKGKFISIIGPNGCGKTTLLNILTGELKPKKGKIFYRQRDLSSYTIKELSKKIAVVRQRTNISFPFTCFDIVMMGRNPYRERLNEPTDEDIDIVVSFMKKTDTYKFMNSLVTEISGGEYQRVMLARALSQSPEILLLDEAFSAMDIAYKVKSLKLLKQVIREKNITVLSIMHDLNLVYKFSDKVCVISNGKVVRYGDSKKVLDQDLIKKVFAVDVELIEGKGFLIT
ncbi:iron complex transport system ATP-binding protein [Caminicella sporogenes DSM 14501]|uniref:Iron complex transport system ATP-binding protein n=1 Tax=Caminicella sporogenes DSM 14501 TaxID=1121266 RepID=A0A1M6PFP8_9FIRM|nr:ABC transporter ATP-binding protein [Caminicella sporogenes]RKD21475.1 hypothetical protein BET04_08230 [Caminicella sporogenes]SHK06776.1 iron complex transport system ATP-binding protein [Caminicella sporogenes DSM 14501]